MVYLSLETIDLNKMIKFYVETLGVFKKGLIHCRVVCTSGTELIIDFIEVKSKPLAGIDFGFIFEKEHLVIFEKLKTSEIEFEHIHNKGGNRIYLKDPEGNKLVINAENRQIS